MNLFHKFTNRYVLECQFDSSECLHIGAGVEGAASDAAFISRDGKPYIPGSTLRGVLRSSLERLLYSLSPHKEPIACTLFVEKGFPQPESCASRNKDYQSPDRWDEFQAKLRAGEIGFCPLCSLFGSTLIASRIKFTDALQRSESAGTTQVRDGVGIDRDTGTAREAIKFTFDVLNPGRTFRGAIHLDNVTDSDLGLVYMMLSLLRSGVEVGGKRSRGFGLVKLTERLTVRGIENTEDLKQFLLTMQMPTVADFEQRAKLHFEKRWEEKFRPVK